ncbi:MAG: GGDEF domain-containing protein [Planctomycetota bacterium]
MRILVAEDDPISRRVLASMLDKWGFEVVGTCDGSEAHALLSGDDPPRLAILDWMMPGIDGVDLTRRLRRSDRQDYVYVILLTAKDRQEDIIAGLEAGADDYVVKPFDAGELKVRLRAAQRIVKLQAELVEARDSLHYQATRDALTGLWNRRAILKLLDDELDRAARDGHPVAVIMGDLDFFKRINDAYGHAAGDEVLREAAARMGGALRAYDQLGRYGGEEFLVVLPGCRADDAVPLAERIRTTVAGEPVGWEGFSLPFTVSLGIATTETPDGLDAEGLICRADAALYRAKQTGRNRVKCAAGSA